MARCKVGLEMAKPPREMLSVLLRSGDGRVVPTNQSARGDRHGSHRGSAFGSNSQGLHGRPGALSRFFRMSRDGWKSKYKDLKATDQGYKNRLAHMTRSRESGRLRLPRDQRSTTESTEIHGKENPNQLPLSVSFPGATPARGVGSFRGYPFVMIFLAGVMRAWPSDFAPTGLTA